MDVTELVDRYCEVWNEPDLSTRRALLASIWADNATYTDPSVHAANAEELLVHIANVRTRRPGASVLRSSAVDIHHGLARFEWHVVQADGAILRDGIDIAFLSADGSRIERIIGFFGPLAGDMARDREAVGKSST
jgi:hypothetical protein